MPKSVTLGTVTSQPGTIQYGQFDALSHPTGHTEFMPVIIAQGKEEGPCLWLTAGIHGPEHTGPAVLYRLITPELVERLRGTIVAIPALNPAGLRTMKREPYHDETDPNRLWPEIKPRPADPDKRPPSALELAFKRLFEAMTASADFMIDYHCAWTDSLSFVFRDRVMYVADPDRAEAEALAARQDEMIRAYGHTIVTEFPIEKYIDEKLHRSTSGAALLVSHIPSFTVELGTGDMPDPRIIQASVAGTRNVLRWAGMLNGEMEPVTGIKVVEPGFRVRRMMTPRVSEAGVVMHLVEAGDRVRPGDPVAELRDIWGRPIGDGLLRSEYEGFVVGRQHGIYFYPGDAVLCLAVRDDAPLVGPYPADYLKKDE